MNGMDLFVMYIIVFFSGWWCACEYLKKKNEAANKECTAPPESQVIIVPKQGEQLFELDYMQVRAVVERMHNSVRSLERMEEILMDDMDNPQKITCVMGTSKDDSDKGNRLHFSTSSLRQAAQMEREELHTSLRRDVDLLCDMRCYGVTQSVTQSAHY